MNLPLFIASRYLVSKKKQHIINIISAIAATGICVGTFALVVVLSVFNGFDGLIKSYFSQLDPDLKITATEGKSFDPIQLTDEVLPAAEGVASYALVLEENALLTYGNRQFIAALKGVPVNFGQITGIDSLMVDGSFTLDKEGINFAIPGQGVATYLGISLAFNEPIHVYVPKKGVRNLTDPARSLNYDRIYPAGVFSLLEEVDSKTVFVPFEFAATLFETGNKVSAIEIKLKEGTNADKIGKLLSLKAGPQYEVKNKYQQHDTLYKTMKSEKWATYLILAFILVIASFNILGSLSMLIIDKKEDILILRSMGATTRLIKQVFLFEGWLVSIAGTAAGLTLGILVCWIQIRFGIVPLPGQGSFVISSYPVDLQVADLLFITVVVLSIGLLASWYPLSVISRKELIINPSGRE